MRRFLSTALPLLAIGICISISSSADAQRRRFSSDTAGDNVSASPGHDFGKGYVSVYAQRPIVLDRGVLRADAGPADFTFLREQRGFYLFKGGFAGGTITVLDPLGNPVTISAGGSSDVGFFAGLGAAFGIIDNLEAGIVLFPLYLAPQADYGDILTYGRYRFLTGNVEIAAQLGFRLPTLSDFGIQTALPVTFHLSQAARLDTGLGFEFTFADPDTFVTLNLPVAFSYNVTPMIFIGGHTGLKWRDLSASESIALPLGVHGGVNILDGRLDITGWFTFTSLFMPGAPSGADKFTAKAWELGTGANFYIALLDR